MDAGLKQRIQTAILIGMVFIPMLLWSNATSQLLFATIMLGMLFEFFKIAYSRHSAGFTYLFTGILLSAGVIFFYLKYLSQKGVVEDFTLFFTLILICVLNLLNVVFLLWQKKSLISRGHYRVQALFYITIPISIVMIFTIHIENFRWILFYIFLIIWTSDSAAYVFGSKYGRKKLFEAVSPKKTYAGFWGAGMASFIAAAIIYALSRDLPWHFWLSTAVLIWLLGTLGDLIESSFKRQFQVKDSGNMLPGHGGLLDRFDSFIFVVPFILLYLNLIP